MAGEPPTTRPVTELKSGTGPQLPTAAPTQHWEDVTGRGVPLPRDSVDGDQFSATPVPGSAIRHAPDSGTTLDVCTVGPTVTGPGGPAVLTAGHCALGSRAATQYGLATAAGPPTVLGTAVGAVDDDRGVDSALVSTPAAAAVPPVIAGTWPVAGVLTVEGVEQLPLGTPICFAGARTGVHCGPLEYTDAAGRLVFGTPDSREGDSGAPVFLVRDGAATLVAMLEGGDEFSTQATYLAPALTRLNARALVDATAHAAVAGQPGYSTRVTAG